MNWPVTNESSKRPSSPRLFIKREPESGLEPLLSSWKTGPPSERLSTRTRRTSSDRRTARWLEATIPRKTSRRYYRADHLSTRRLCASKDLGGPAASQIDMYYSRGHYGRPFSGLMTFHGLLWNAVFYRDVCQASRGGGGGRVKGSGSAIICPCRTKGPLPVKIPGPAIASVSSALFLSPIVFTFCPPLGARLLHSIRLGLNFIGGTTSPCHFSRPVAFKVTPTFHLPFPAIPYSIKNEIPAHTYTKYTVAYYTTLA
jgi:hypothetical protein